MKSSMALMVVEVKLALTWARWRVGGRGEERGGGGGGELVRQAKQASGW
jgi:hypothetical protein